MNAPTDLPPDAAVTDQRAGIALRAALTMMLPLARWLVRHGVHYASFAPALKSVFVEAARRELHAAGARQTDSALSVLSGVHRRDIRELARGTPPETRPRTPSVASQVFTRWVTDPAYRDAADRPMALPKTGAGRSFDTLARQISSDVHPRTLMDEMLRLGLVEQADDSVRLCAEAFLPQQGFDGDTAMFAANVGDHMAAATHNLGAPAARFLEQSVFGNGLTAQSVDALGDTARRLWAQAFEQFVRESTSRYQADRSQPEAHMRMRFGVYYYAEPVTRNDAQDGPEAVAH